MIGSENPISPVLKIKITIFMPRKPQVKFEIQPQRVAGNNHRFRLESFEFLRSQQLLRTAAPPGAEEAAQV
jgi:hypothetical protein